MEVFQGKLGVDGQKAGISLDGGVNNGAGLEGVLKKDRAFGKHLADEVFENLFADIAAKLGAFEIVLEVFHGAADLGKNPGLFFQITNDGSSPI